MLSSENQQILFQYEYVNYAWGYQHNGFIIDNEGKILTYNNPENWNFREKESNLTEAQVAENISKCKDSGKKISHDELTEIQQLHKKHCFKPGYCTEKCCSRCRNI